MTSTRTRRWPRAAVVAVGAVLILTTASGCALLPPSSDAPGPGGTAYDAALPRGSDDASAAAPERVEPDAATVRADGTAVPLGPFTVWVLVTPPDDGATAAPDVVASSSDGAAAGQVVEVTLTGVPATGDGGLPTVHLAGLEGTTPDLLNDGSLTFRDAGGVAVAGVEAPAVQGEDGPAARFRSGADVVAVVVPSDPFASLGDPEAATPGSAAEAVTVTLRLSASAIVSATWGENEGGRSLAVVPTDWLCAGSMAAQEVGWSRLVTDDPEVDSSTMRDQYDCHALGARDKASWNLEPWRPDVGAFAVLAARCNPT